MARANPGGAPESSPDKPDDTIRLGPFSKGMNNVDRAINLGNDELVNAVNLDIDRHGKLSTRPGYTRVIAEPDTHSLYQRDDSTAFYVSGTDLKVLQVDPNGNLQASVLLAGRMTRGLPVAYAQANFKTYFSNAVFNGAIRADNTVHPWGIERPRSNPILTAVPGNLPAGGYLVGISFLNDEGEEGGMNPVVPITVSANSSISVALPQPVSADITTIRVYMSSQNSETLFRYADLPTGTLSTQLFSVATDGMVANTIVMDVMPPGDILEYYRGRIYSGLGLIASHSIAMRYGLTNRQSEYTLFEEPLTMIRAVTDGIFFGTQSRVWFFHGEGPGKFTRKMVANYGAIKGTAITFPNTQDTKGAGVVVGWFSERGFVKGFDGGKIELDVGTVLASGSKERVMIGMYERGAAFYRELNGIRQVVGTMRGGVRSGLVSTDYAEAEVRRNGTII